MNSLHENVVKIMNNKSLWKSHFPACHFFEQKIWYLKLEEGSCVKRKGIYMNFIDLVFFIMYTVPKELIPYNRSSHFTAGDREVYEIGRME